MDTIYKNNKSENSFMGKPPPTKPPVPPQKVNTLDNNKVKVDEDVDVGKNRVIILFCSCFNWL